MFCNTRPLQINAGILNLMADEGYVPVISTVAIGEDGESYNVNADHAAGALAAEVKAAKLIMLTDVEGLYRDFSDKSSLISEMSVADAQAIVSAALAAAA